MILRQRRGRERVQLSDQTTHANDDTTVAQAGPGVDTPLICAIATGGAVEVHQSLPAEPLCSRARS